MMFLNLKQWLQMIIQGNLVHFTFLGDLRPKIQMLSGQTGNKDL